MPLAKRNRVTGRRTRRRGRGRPSLVHTAASYAVVLLALSPVLYGLETGTLLPGRHPPSPAPSSRPPLREEMAAPAPPPVIEPAPLPGPEAVPSPAEAAPPAAVESKPEAPPIQAIPPELAVREEPAPVASVDPPPAAHADEAPAAADPLAAMPAPPPIPDSPAVAVEHPQPQGYPEDSWRRGYEGSTVVTAMVGEDGLLASDPAVSRSSGAADLDAAAMAAFRRWRFRPAIQGGHPVPDLVQGEFVFRLR